MEIPEIQSSSPLSIGKLGGRSKAESPSGQIGQSFAEALDSLGKSQIESDQLVQMLAAGENVDLHQVMIAAEQTDINFRIAMSIRDRLVEAYREINRMAV
jgi:flagellar hook-basal body complex protein FliE